MQAHKQHFTNRLMTTSDVEVLVFLGLSHGYMCVLYWSCICGSATDIRKEHACAMRESVLLLRFLDLICPKNRCDNNGVLWVTASESNKCLCVFRFWERSRCAHEKVTNLQLKRDRNEAVATRPKSKYIKSDKRMRRYRNADNIATKPTQNVTKVTQGNKATKHISEMQTFCATKNNKNNWSTGICFQDKNKKLRRYHDR